MKATELRIGNTVRRHGVLVNIDARSIFDIWDNSGMNNLGYEPLLLTERWLLKFGFTYNEDKGDSSDEADRKIYSLGGFDVSVEEDGSIRAWEEVGDHFYSFYGKKFEYVHRLQNYYYEHTDKELAL